VKKNGMGSLTTRTWHDSSISHWGLIGAGVYEMSWVVYLNL
jgi:hypothetical protein